MRVLADAAAQPWYDAAATIATIVAAIGAIGAIIVGIFTIRERAQADARAQWWARVQWAVDLSFDEERARRTVGFEALALLARSPLAGSGDLDFLRGLTLDALAAVQVRGEGPFVGGRARNRPRVQPEPRDDRATGRGGRGAAARATDATQGVPTQAWIEELARTSTG